MYRKAIATLVLGMSSTFAFGQQDGSDPTTHHMMKHHIHKKCHATKHVDYKDEMAVRRVVPCVTRCYSLNGPYAGLSIGPRVNYTGLPTVYKGFEGTVSLGYGAMFSEVYYLAAEILAADSANLKDYRNGGEGVKSTWSYGLSVLPGMLITDDILGYLRLGVIHTRFSDEGTNKTGWQVGVGGQANLYQNWDMRAEYVYSQYSRISDIGKPCADQFNVGIIYKFEC